MSRNAIYLFAFFLILGVSAQDSRDNFLRKRRGDIKCYTCTNCDKVSDTTPITNCPVDIENPLEYQKCVKYIEKYKDFDEPYVVRGCMSETGNCQEIKNAHDDSYGIDLVLCTDCPTDKCNLGALTKSVPKVIAFLSLVIVPLLKVYTLS